MARRSYMTRTALFVIGILAMSILSFAQGRGGAPAAPPPLEPGASQADVDKALIAAPGSQRDGATVIKWKPDFTYDTLKKGTNRLVCYDLSGYPTHPPFMLECTSTANLDRVAQNLKIEAISDKDARQAAFDKAEKDGTRVKPEFGSMWLHLMGM